MRWPWQKSKVEQRASGSGYTTALIEARAAYIAGRSGIAELTATVQSCVSLWEGCFALADVEGTDLLSRRTLALIARSLALKGEALFVIRDDRLVPASGWDVSTRDGFPTAYRVTMSECGGGRTETVLSGEVLHVVIGSDPAQPWSGSAPLRRAQLTAGMLDALESALAEVYATAPIGSQIVPFPEVPETDLTTLGGSFRAQRGRVLLRESVAVTAAGGPVPGTDWRPADVTPDLRGVQPLEALAAARGAICAAFGVLPALFDQAAQGPLVREAQRHLAQWTLQPIAMLLAEEGSRKFGGEVLIDVCRPVQAYDAGGRARTLAAVVEAIARAKEAGLSPADLTPGLTWVNAGPGDDSA